MSEQFSFQTEVNQLLKLMIHSLYSEREIFLRELIANASDACDKLRFQALTDENLMDDGAELAVHINYDKEQKIITVSDNGIGMNREEIIDNIGTIARSGTKKFMDAMGTDKSKDTQLIGQFGVGFYSAFMVAENVEVLSRKAGDNDDQAVLWSSNGEGEFTLDTATKAQSGTLITLKLREEGEEFLEHHRLQHIIKKYSEHLSLPIYLPELDDEGKQTDQFSQVNQGSAIWNRSKKEVSDDEYQAFYKTLSYDQEPPLATIHNKVEGNLEYDSLFFIPSKAPFDLWDKDRKHGIKLYIRRVFILDDTEHLLPTYLRFVRGVIDAADLPLNVSREFLQNNREITNIRNASVKKVLNELSALANNEPEQYVLFWNEFGKVLKEGMIEDQLNQKTIAPLLRFSSNKTALDETISLDTYLERKKENQQSIYFLTADSHRAAMSSPHLESFKKNDVEVLLLTDPVDEWLIAHMADYNDVSLKSISKASDFSDVIQEDESNESQDSDYQSVLENMKEALSDRVKDVRLSKRLTDSPSCITADEHELGMNMERILKAMGQDAPDTKPILEINPGHDLVTQLKSKDKEIQSLWAHVLLDQATLSEGGHLNDPADYVKRINQLLMSV